MPKLCYNAPDGDVPFSHQSVFWALFMFFKKNKTKDTQELHQLEQQARDVVYAYTFGDYALKNDVTSCALDEKGVLALSVRLPKTISPEQVHAELGERLYAIGIPEINMNVTLYEAGGVGVHKPAAQDRLPPHPRIRHIIAIASGKGGVGKSTTAVNLALALKAAGHRVGLLDADIYGPSLPDMLGVAGVKPVMENGQFVPIDAYGMPMMSIGSLIDDGGTPIAWRGIKATGALMQMFNDTAFGHLDYLLIDMPPGTGDIQLSLAQKIPITAAIIVTTPQHIALLDVKKGMALFEKTHIPILGVIENMAMYTCSQCGHSEPIFGADGGRLIAEQYGVPLLGQLPLTAVIREKMDQGAPVALDKDSHAGEHYHAIARKVAEMVIPLAKPKDETRIF